MVLSLGPFEALPRGRRLIRHRSSRSDDRGPGDSDEQLTEWKGWLEDVRRQLRHAHLHQIVGTEVRSAAQRWHPDADHTFLWRCS
jgi:hypothetical protein